MEKILDGLVEDENGAAVRKLVIWPTVVCTLLIQFQCLFEEDRMFALGPVGDACLSQMRTWYGSSYGGDTIIGRAGRFQKA